MAPRLNPDDDRKSRRTSRGPSDGYARAISRDDRKTVNGPTCVHANRDVTFARESRDPMFFAVYVLYVLLAPGRNAFNALL